MVTSIKSYGNAVFEDTCNTKLIRPGGFKITLDDGKVYDFGDTKQEGCHKGMPVASWNGKARIIGFKTDV